MPAISQPLTGEDVDISMLERPEAHIDLEAEEATETAGPSSHKTDPSQIPIEVLRRGLAEAEEKEQLLEQTLEIYQRIYGDNLDLFPPHLRSIARGRARSKRPRSPSEDSDDDRRTSLHAESSQFRHKLITAMLPSPYYGKSMKELTSYIQACSQCMDAVPERFPNDIAKITFFQTLLRGDAATSWERLRKTGNAYNRT